jgi:hypothetical protein
VGQLDVYNNGFELTAGLGPYLGIRETGADLRNGVGGDLMLEYRIRFERYQWIFGLHTGLVWLGSVRRNGGSEAFFLPFMVASGMGTRSTRTLKILATVAAGPAISILNTVTEGTEIHLAIAARAGLGIGIRLLDKIYMEITGSAYVLQRGSFFSLGILPAGSIEIQL